MSADWFSTVNEGPAIVSTTYWDTEHAASGLCYLSPNAGSLRLLVPDAAAGMLSEMATGRKAKIEPSIVRPGQCWDIVFDDGTPEPFCLTLDRKSVERTLKRGEYPLAVWSQRGKELELPLSRRSYKDKPMQARRYIPGFFIDQIDWRWAAPVLVALIGFIGYAVIVVPRSRLVTPQEIAASSKCVQDLVRSTPTLILAHDLEQFQEICEQRSLLEP